MKTKRMQPWNKGFTLIELLVVLGIISMLFGILVPVVSKVRAKGKIIVCRANLHNLALAMIMYLDSNKNIMPPAAQVPSINTSKPSIPHFLLHNVSNQKKVFKCPADRGHPSKFESEGTSYEYMMGIGGKPGHRGPRHVRRHTENCESPVGRAYCETVPCRKARESRFL